MQYAQLKPLTNYATRNMLHVLGISSDYSFFNGDVTFRGLEGDSQMLIMGLIKDYLHQYGYSEVGLEDFLLHDAHSFYYHPIKEILFGEPLWDHQDRLHGDLVTKVMRTATKQEAVYICKWLHQCLALGFNEDINPLGAAGVLVLYGCQNI